jgi:hypothetical protein
MAPEVRIYIPPNQMASFKHAVPGFKGRVLATTPIPEDYADEIYEEYTTFTDKLSALEKPNPDPETESKVLEAYRRLIPHLSNREVFKAGETSRIPRESLIELRSALVNDFKQSLDPEPKRVNGPDVADVIGSARIEMILMFFGLENGEPMTAAEISREMGYPASKVNREIESYFDKIIRQARLPRKHRGEVSRVIFKIASQLS